MVRHDRRLPQMPLTLGRLLLQDVAGEGVPTLDLSLGGQLEALLGARMGLHLRHDDPRVKQTPCGTVGCGGSGRRMSTTTAGPAAPAPPAPRPPRPPPPRQTARRRR